MQKCLVDTKWQGLLRGEGDTMVRLPAFSESLAIQISTRLTFPS